MQISVIILLSLPPLSFTRFFDTCPARRQSIGACLAGLCPAGSECINGYCCKTKKGVPLEKAQVEIDESAEFGNCSNGRKAIGECISNSCPIGYSCVNGVCCAIGKGTTKLPSTATQSSLIATISTEDEQTSVSSAPRIDVTTHAETVEAIEEHLVGSSEELSTTTVYSTSPTPETDVEESEEVDTIDTSTEVPTTSATPVTTTKKAVGTRRHKSKKTTVDTTTLETTTTEHPTTVPSPMTTDEKLALVHEKCPVGEPIGECISNRCPEGHSCLDGVCCILTPQINCTDELVGCLTHLCDRKGYKQFMTNNCPKTCARCHLANISTNELLDCRDRRSDCEEWAAEGFCESTLYTTRQKIKFCGKSCKLC